MSTYEQRVVRTTGRFERGEVTRANYVDLLESYLKEEKARIADLNKDWEVLWTASYMDASMPKRFPTLALAVEHIEGKQERHGMEAGNHVVIQQSPYISVYVWKDNDEDAHTAIVRYDKRN